MLHVTSVSDVLGLPRGKWGIPEPGNVYVEGADAGSLRATHSSITPSLDLILVPGVAFDTRCWRLGHGKGYYDIFLQSLRSFSKPAAAVGLCLDEQMVECVPRTDYDQQLDVLVTPTHVHMREEKAQGGKEGGS